jgi:pyruvate kinase
MRKNKKTKIVCTIGPASWDFETLKALAEAGMDVARLNFSHGTHDEKRQQIALVRQISQEINKPLAVVADLQGPKLRLGKIEGTVEVKKGDQIILSSEPQEGEVPLQFDLSPFVTPDQRIFLNDGLIELKVLEVSGKSIKTEAQNDGVYSSNKGVNVPDTRIKDGIFSDKDFEDARCALEENVEYLALSFIQAAEDVKPMRDLINEYKSNTQIIAKIEKKEAIDNLEAIMEVVDAVMIARGDLAIETSASEVPIHQQKITKIARQYQKPVIVATQMLESMTENPRPTRAEASDVGNAVLDQVDAVMLSAESASGKYPVETVKMMTEIIQTVEMHPDYSQYIKINWEHVRSENRVFSAIVSSAAALGYRIDAKAIAVGTTTGRTARLISIFRPGPAIFAATHDEKTYRQMALLWGVRPIIIPATPDVQSFWTEISNKVSQMQDIESGDSLIMVSGANVGITGATDTIKVVTL